MSDPLHVCLDATPLLGLRTGVGRYVSHLLESLAADPALSIGATAFTWRGMDGLAPRLPIGVTARARRAPARLLQLAWARHEWPSAELMTGPFQVVHGTNFVLPPLRNAAGVVTIHDLSYLRTPDTVSGASARYRTLVPRSLARAAVVCTPSRAVADEVIAEYELAQDRVVVTPLGVDSAWNAASAPTLPWLAAHGLPARYLLFVGTLEPRKNLATLIEAYRLLVHDSRQHVGHASVPPLVLVGPPGWGAELDLSGLPRGAVLTPGYLEEATLRLVVAGAAALAFPSRYEGFGLPPLEALACGTPVVASDLAVTREVLGEHVRYALATDSVAWATALADTLRVGGPTTAAARRAYAAGWTWQATAAATTAAYRLAAL